MPNCVFVGPDECGRIELFTEKNEPDNEKDWVIFHFALVKQCISFRSEDDRYDGISRWYLFESAVVAEKARLEAESDLIRHKQAQSLILAMQDIFRMLEDIKITIQYR